MDPDAKPWLLTVAMVVYTRFAESWPVLEPCHLSLRELPCRPFLPTSLGEKQEAGGWRGQGCVAFLGRAGLPGKHSPLWRKSIYRGSLARTSRVCWERVSEGLQAGRFCCLLLSCWKGIIIIIERLSLYTELYSLWSSYTSPLGQGDFCQPLFIAGK